MKSDFIVPFTNDKLFKSLFLRKKTKKTCERFINEVMNLKKEKFLLSNTEMPIFGKNERRKVTDVIYSRDDYNINIEMNREYYGTLFKRNFRYLSAFIVSKSKAGKENKNKEFFYQININDFNRFNKAGKVKEKYSLLEEEKYSYLSDFITIYNLSLLKAESLYYNGDERYLVKFLTALKCTSRNELLKICEGDEELMAMANLSDSLNMEKYWDYEQDAKEQEIEYREYIKEQVMKKGMRKGKKLGMQQLIQTVRNMLSEKVDVPFISKVTNLSVEEIEKIKAKMS